MWYSLQLEPDGGIEPPTPCLEPARGIEPRPPPYHGGVLPLAPDRQGCLEPSRGAGPRPERLQGARRRRSLGIIECARRDSNSRHED